MESRLILYFDINTWVGFAVLIWVRIFQAEHSCNDFLSFIANMLNLNNIRIISTRLFTSVYCSCGSLLVNMVICCFLRENYFMLGEAGEKKTPTDDTAGLEPDPR